MSTVNYDELNIKYATLSPEQRIVEMFKDFPSEKILFTSSFGTTAAILLHMISKVNPNQKVYFLDTTYHFMETLDYKNQLKELLNLNIVDIKPEDWKNDFTTKDKINAIFSFVKTRMNWNEKFGYYTDKGVVRAYQEKVGNAAEINFILLYCQVGRVVKAVD